MGRFPKAFAPLFTFSFLTASQLFAAGTSYIWQNNGDGDWETTANWTASGTGTTFPSSQGDTATFDDTVNQPTMLINVTAAEKLGILNFNNSQGTQFTLKGQSGSLSFDNAGLSQINVSGNGSNQTISVPITLNDNINIDVANNLTLNITQTISQSGGVQSITKINPGDLLLSDNNTYSGTTKINQGRVIASNSSSLGTGPTQIASSATLIIDGVGLSISNAITNSGGIIQNNGVNNTLSGGSVTIDSTGSTFIIGSGAQLTVAEDLSDNNGKGFSQSGNGTLVLDNNNSSFTGIANIQAGSLSLKNSGSLGTGSANISSGATLQIDGSGLSISNAINSYGGTIQNTANGSNILSGQINLNADSSFDTLGASNTLTLSGVVTGLTGFTKTGPGTLSLSGNNNYAGITTIDNGNITYNQDGAIPAGNQLILNNNTITNPSFTFNASVTDPNAFKLNLAAPTNATQNPNVNVFLSTLEGSGTLNLANSGKSTFTLKNTSTFDGKITGGSQDTTNQDTATGNSLIFDGSAQTFTLSSATSDYTSRTFLNNGMLVVKDKNALGKSIATGGSPVFVGTGTTLNLNGMFLILDKKIYSNATIQNSYGTNTITGDVILGWSTPADSTIDVPKAGDTLGFTGSISGPNGFNKTGLGKLIISGNSGANTYSGDTNIKKGSVSYDKDGALPAGKQVNIDDDSSAILTFTRSMTPPNAFNLKINGSGTASQQPGTNVFLNKLEGSGGLILASSGTSQFVVTETSQFDGQITGGENTTGFTSLVFDGTNQTFTLTNNTSDYLSNTHLKNGILNIQATNALGASSLTGSTLNLDSGTTFQLQNNISLAKDIFSNSATIENLSDSNTINGKIALSGPTPKFTITDGSLDLQGKVTGTSLLKEGAGTLILSAVNSFTGTASVTAGTLSYNTDGAIPSSTQVNMTGGSKFEFNADMSSGNAFKLDLATATSANQNNGKTVVLETLTNSGDLTLASSGTSPFTITKTSAFPGKITGGLQETTNQDHTTGNSLIFDGSGQTFTLSSSTSDYASRTFLNKGKLVVTNQNALGKSIANGGSPVFVGTGTTLNLNGVSLTLDKKIYSNATIQNGSGTNTITGDLILGWSTSADSTIDVPNALDTLVFTGSITGTKGFTKTGLGNLTISGNSGANTYSGDTNIDQGSVTYEKDGALPAGGQVNIANDATAILTFKTSMTPSNAFNLNIEGPKGSSNQLKGSPNQLTSASIFLNKLTGSGNLILDTVGPSQFVVTGTSQFGGLISGGTADNSNLDTTGSVFIKKGPSTILTLTNPNSTYAGRFFVEEGTLAIDNGAALGAASAAYPSFAGGVFVSSAATLDLLGGINLNKNIFLTGTLTNKSGTNTIGASNTVESTGLTTIDVKGSSTLKLPGVLAGSGTLIKDSTGTLSLEGSVANTFSGLIDVTQGTLNLAKNPTTSAIAGDLHITGTGTVTAITNHGQFADTCNVTLDGGTLTFTGTNQSMGSLTWKTGIFNQAADPIPLTFTNTGTALSIRGNLSITTPITILRGGTVLFDPIGSGTATLSNISFPTSAGTINIPLGDTNPDMKFIASSGVGFKKTGSGILELGSAAHSHHTGILTLNDGSLNISTGSTLSFGKTIVNAGTLNILTNPTSAEIGTGATGFTISGGTVNIGTASAPLTTPISVGGLNMSGGTLVLNGEFKGGTNSAHFTGGTLSGNGILDFASPGGVVFDHGSTLSPGNSVGIMTINGPTTFNAGSTYAFEINAGPPLQSDLIHVNGPITINGGTLQVAQLDGNPFPTNFSITLIENNPTDQPIVLGSANPFNIISPARLRPAPIDYEAHAIKLEFDLIPFGSLFNGNAGAIGSMLDKNDGAFLGTGISDLILALNILPTDALQEALDAISPEILKGLPISSQNNSVRSRSAVTHRLGEVSSACKAEKCKANVWSSVDGDFYHQHGKGFAKAFRTNSVVASLGIDRVNEDNFFFGIANAFSNSKTSWKRNETTGHIQSGYMNFYAGTFGKEYFVNALVQAGINHYEHARSIVFTGVDQTAKSQYFGRQGLFHLSGGYIWNQDKLSLRPFLSLDYSMQSQEGFKEHGADALNLNLEIDKSKYRMLRTEAGVNVIYCIDSADFNTTLDGKLSYVREDRFKGSHYRGSLIGADGSFNVIGLSPDHNLVSPEIGVTIKSPCGRFNVRLGYAGEFGKEHRVHNAQLKAGVAF